MFRPLSGPGSAPTGSLGETLVRNDNIDGKKSEFSPVFVIFLLVEKQTVRYDQRLRVNGGYQHGCVSCVGCTCRSWSGGVYERREFKPVKKNPGNRGRNQAMPGTLYWGEETTSPSYRGSSGGSRPYLQSHRGLIASDRLSSLVWIPISVNQPSRVVHP